MRLLVRMNNAGIIRKMILEAIQCKCSSYCVHRYCRKKHINTSVEFTIDFLFRYLENAYNNNTTKDEHLEIMSNIIKWPPSTLYAKIFLKISAIYFENIFAKKDEQFIMYYFNMPSTKMALAWANLFVARYDKYIDDDIRFLTKCLVSGYGCISSAAKNKILLLGAGEETAVCDTWNDVLRGNKTSYSSSPVPILTSAVSMLRPVLL